jgi:transcriptional regulator with XRE-family HTH domain
MGTRNGRTQRGRRRIEEDLLRVRADLGAARRAAGLSLEQVASMSHIAGSTAGRIESGFIRDPDLRILASLAATVGLELRLRAYPNGDPIRDAGQQRLIQRLRLRLHPDLSWRTEVPLPVEGDLRAWDAVVRTTSWRVAVEAETVLEDIQSVERRLALKQRDGDIDHVILLVADTRRNRRALASAPAAFAGLSRNSRPVMRALARGEDPGTSAIVLL